jgi:CheY-like chemotaxis protein
VRPHLEAGRHELRLSVPPHAVWFDGDAARLEQVVVNLLHNAAKFTERAGEIRLTAGVEDHQFVLRVSDAGIGIAPEMLPRIFDLFEQADRSLDRSQGGLGIGLTLVRRLVGMHGGTVGAKSEGIGKGSEFTVRLPLPAEPARPVPETPPPRGVEAGRRSLNVLVVDDNVDQAESLSLVLRMYGHDTKMAHTGPAALDAARLYRPDVVLLDIGLPGMDGCEVARRLPATLTARPLLIAVTGYGQDEKRRCAAEAGFDEYLIKPVDIGQLQQMLHRAGG